MGMYFFVCLSSDCIHVHISVNLKFPKKIQLGKELKLDCESSNAIPSHRSRQWRGGSDNQLLCYDGTTVDSTKYIEKRISSRRYELIVEETSENDLQCPYACRVGFDIDQKFLEVNEHNFLRKLFMYLEDSIFEKKYCNTYVNPSNLKTKST